MFCVTARCGAAPFARESTARDGVSPTASEDDDDDEEAKGAAVRALDAGSCDRICLFFSIPATTLVISKFGVAGGGGARLYFGGREPDGCVVVGEEEAVGMTGVMGVTGVIGEVGEVGEGAERPDATEDIVMEAGRRGGGAASKNVWSALIRRTGNNR